MPSSRTRRTARPSARTRLPRRAASRTALQPRLRTAPSLAWRAPLSWEAPARRLPRPQPRGLEGAVGAAAAAPAAVVYLGSPGGLAALAEAAAAAPAAHPSLGSALWFASDMSAGSHLLAGSGAPAAEFAARVGLEALQWRAPANDVSRGIDSRLPHGGPGTARDYAAYDAAFLLGRAASASAGGPGGASAAAVAAALPGAAAAYAGALGDIALDSAGDLWVPAKYDVWAVAQAAQGSGAGAPEWVRRAGAADGARACSITLERAKIDYGPLDPGQTSRPYLQTISNTGQLAFAEVEAEGHAMARRVAGRMRPWLPPFPAGGAVRDQDRCCRRVFRPCRQGHSRGQGARGRKQGAPVVQAQPGRARGPAAGRDQPVRHVRGQVPLGGRGHTFNCALGRDRPCSMQPGSRRRRRSRPPL